jgi:hypothetical protein
LASRVFPRLRQKGFLKIGIEENSYFDSIVYILWNRT